MAGRRRPRIVARFAAVSAVFLQACSRPEPAPSASTPPAAPVAVVEPPPVGVHPARTWQEQTRSAFRALDRNRDGKLDLDEIRAGFAVFDADGDGFVSRFEAWQLVEAGDRDGDGRLSPDEVARLRGFAPETDRDGDGKVSALEFSLARTDEFVRADVNRDGRLDPEEIARTPRFTLFRF